MWQGTLTKMGTRHEAVVAYTLADNSCAENSIEMNALLGRKLRVQATGNRFCVDCGAPATSLFRQGSCYTCFTTLPQNDECIFKPELCHYHSTTNPCRDPAWGERICFAPHVLYLAVSSNLKVGITRQTQVPVRWMDQGASYAVPVLKVKDRLTVGQIEHSLKGHFADKTNWQRMLKNEVAEVDLNAARQQVLERVSHEHEVIEDPPIYTFEYPSLEWPAKIKSFNLEKNPLIEGRLIAIKGQYLLLDSGVINIRKFGGWEVSLDVED